MLVIPKIRAGAACRTCAGLKWLATKIERCIRGKIWMGRSPAMIWILDLEAYCHPAFAEDWETLLAWTIGARKTVIDGNTGMQVGPHLDVGRRAEMCKRWTWQQTSETEVVTFEGQQQQQQQQPVQCHGNEKNRCFDNRVTSTTETENTTVGGGRTLWGGRERATLTLGGDTKTPACMECTE